MITFSETIMRLMKKQENFLKLASTWKKIPESADAIRIIEETIEEARNRPNEPINVL